MKAYEILQRFPEEAAGEIFQYLYANDKPAYRACLQVLATRRKLRPIVLERKTRAGAPCLDAQRTGAEEQR